MVKRRVPKPFLSLSSARISRLFAGFCSLFLRMWSHTFETTSLRGSGAEPTTAASSGDGVTGRASPPPALRPVPLEAFAMRPSCCSEETIERKTPRARESARNIGLTPRQAERDDPVGRIVANIGCAAKFDSSARAPVPNDGPRVIAERRIIVGNLAHQAK